MPGSWPEPFGLVAIEALACGTPVIARRVGGLPEIIRDGIDGFFGDDVEQLAYQVSRVDDAGPGGDPGVRAGPVLGRADDRWLRGDLSGDARLGGECRDGRVGEGGVAGQPGRTAATGGEPRPLKPVMSDASDLATSGRAS